MLVVIDRENPELVSWYRNRGYAVGEPDQHGLIQLWSDRKHRSLRYDEKGITSGQRLGAKSLAGHVSVTDLRGMVRIAGLLDDAGGQQSSATAELVAQP
jgi:hypothetical protein